MREESCSGEATESSHSCFLYTFPFERASSPRSLSPSCTRSRLRERRRLEKEDSADSMRGLCSNPALLTAMA